MTASTIDVRPVTGSALRRSLGAVAALRIAIFREWPYLYDGDADYERDYLAAYADSIDSVFVLAFDGDRVVGASTGLPLSDDQAAFAQPFLDRGDDIARIFYFGESVLLPAYRGQGIGHAFFDHREAHARSLQRFDLAAFCAVDRDPTDARRPPGHRGNEHFWTKRGYVRQPGLTMHLPWNEIGHGEVEHALTFWMRPLRNVERV
jgi:GNAT superfamily N-acetyltransferase